MQAGRRTWGEHNGRTGAKLAEAPQLHDLLGSFELSLRAANKAPRTIETYGESVRQLINYLEAAGLPTDLGQLDSDRYLRKRARHEYAGLDALWVSRKGPLSTSGLRQLMERRCDQAGIPRIHPHALRHHFAHSWLLQAGAESELMALTGWKSRAMLSRYAASTVAERAGESHRRLLPGDRISGCARK